jgi:hypothetical protein
MASAAANHLSAASSTSRVLSSIIGLPFEGPITLIPADSVRLSHNVLRRPDSRTERSIKTESDKRLLSGLFVGRPSGSAETVRPIRRAALATVHTKTGRACRPARLPLS